LCEAACYILEESKAADRDKRGNKEKRVDSPECLAAMCFHAPNKGQQIRGLRLFAYLFFHSVDILFLNELPCRTKSLRRIIGMVGPVLLMASFDLAAVPKGA
jgi:hypothetical protein